MGAIACSSFGRRLPNLSFKFLGQTIVIQAHNISLLCCLMCPYGFDTAELNLKEGVHFILTLLFIRGTSLISPKNT